MVHLGAWKCSYPSSCEYLKKYLDRLVYLDSRVEERTELSCTHYKRARCKWHITEER